LQKPDEQGVKKNIKIIQIQTGYNHCYLSIEWNGFDFFSLPLIKAKGKCTTEHIQWLGSVKISRAS